MKSTDRIVGLESWTRKRDCWRYGTSLLEKEQTRSWAAFSNLNRKKKTAFFARGKP
jgi:hypothetical protein